MRCEVSPRQRIVSLWFPELATDRLERLERGASWRSRGAETLPRAVIATRKGTERIVALNAAARALGILVGEPLADARARHPGLASDAQAPAEEAALLAALADWCDRYTPLVALDGDDGLLPDELRVRYHVKLYPGQPGGWDAELETLIFRSHADISQIEAALLKPRQAHEFELMQRYGEFVASEKQIEESAVVAHESQRKP